MRVLLALCLLGGVTRAVEWDAVQEALARPVVDLAPGVVIRRLQEAEEEGSLAEDEEGGSLLEDEEGRLLDDVEDYVRSHALEVRLPIVGKAVGKVLGDPRFSFGKNSFLTGFGLGFLAFGLKKLLLPLFIGAQIVKSILIAMFLPSILGGIGKLVGKGVTSVAHSSGAGHQPASETISDFDFKDNINHYDSEQAGSEGQFGVWSYPPAASSGMDTTPLRLPPSLPMPSALTAASNKNSYHERYPVKLGSKHQHGSFYSKETQQDYRVFHNIPTSSHLLAHYDPFYSPLLSRLDSVFQQLATSREACRERLVCDMYKAPAKFAPYSNLVSAQLSRELNELRKPSSDNPEILRFFRYMKAAKDGQDGMDCLRVYKGCGQPSPALQASPMVATFNDINKLVQARHS